MLTQEFLNSILYYNPEDGHLRWKPLPMRYPNGRVRSKPNPKAHRIAGAKHTARNCIQISIENKLYKSHRLIWIMLYGTEPRIAIDHINGNGFDNRLENLREASISENAQNMAIRADNLLGYTGVSRDARRGTYNAEIKIEGRRIRKSGFKTAEDAHKIYQELKQKHHTFHPKKITRRRVNGENANI